MSNPAETVRDGRDGTTDGRTDSVQNNMPPTVNSGGIIMY